ncbi:hypothetical protein QBC44DRAFT_302833 [Cladorrhinum sp. PSN332]|nr:hypothetical protein QBC44DRAFT_302833 [Cladorrhinum sp. PSN332]
MPVMFRICSSAKVSKPTAPSLTVGSSGKHCRVLKRPARYNNVFAFFSGRMKNIPSKYFRPSSRKTPTPTNSTNTLILPSGGQSTQASRPSLTPLRPTTQKIDKRRGYHKNKKPPDSSTDKVIRHLAPENAQETSPTPSPGILSATHSGSYLPVMDGYDIGSSSSSDPGQGYFDWVESEYRYSPGPIQYFLDPTQHHQDPFQYYQSQIQEGPQQLQHHQEQPRRAWRREPATNMQSIPDTFNRRFECVTAGEFTANHRNASVNYNRVILSQLYTASYIWEQTVTELGFEITPGRPPLRMDPRTSRTLEPIGWCQLYVQLQGPEHPSIHLIRFGVLAGSPAAAGVHCIIGQPDLDDIYGPGLDIERYNRERGA